MVGGEGEKGVRFQLTILFLPFKKKKFDDVSLMCLRGNDVAYDRVSDLAILSSENTWHHLIGADMFIFVTSALTIKVSNGK